MEWSTTETSFLDTKVYLQNGKLHTDLYTKPTDCHQYLRNTSCHPQHNKSAIPFSQALRYRRICSEDTNFSKHCHELQKNLIRRGYPKVNILRDIERLQKYQEKRVYHHQQDTPPTTQGYHLWSRTTHFFLTCQLC